MKWEDLEDLIGDQLINAVQLFRNEKNDEATWKRLYDVAEAILEPLLGWGILDAFKVVCDGRVNDQEALDANELHLQFGIKLTADDERFRTYHIGAACGDKWFAVMNPPGLIDEDEDFVNRETNDEI